jgi:penicillin-binding protein 1C
MKRVKYIAIVFFFSIICALLLLIYFSLPEKPILFNKISASHAVYDTHNQLLRLSLSSDEKYRLFTPLSKISQSIIKTTLLYEDRYFYFHYGINPFALFNAAFSNLFSKKAPRGASTITMQLARLRYDITTKSIYGKLKQIALSLLLEWHYTKNEILEAYLNLAPYGENIEGIGAASLIYFNKLPHNLTLSESLHLSIIPQNPNERAPKKNTQAYKEAVQRIYTLWNSVNDAKEYVNAVIFSQRSDLPNKAPHFVDMLLNSSPENPLMHTTLSLHHQDVITHVLNDYLSQVKQYGIKNASIILADWRKNEIISLIGSADYFDKAIQGQVNGALAKRSPGSALKPFIYALGMDQGLLHPLTLLKDTPSSFAGYTPENFDKDFLGPIAASDALVRSRNIPALIIANKLQNMGLYGLLKKAGISGMFSEKEYGLSLVLGGVDVSLKELVTLYGSLARGGKLFQFSMLKDEYTHHTDNHKTAIDIVTPEASYITLQMLKTNPSPDSNEENTGNFTKNRRGVPWKTGTSYGFKDAWSVGIVGDYVLGVWIGNFNGESNTAFIGRESAGKLFFDIIDRLSERELIKHTYILSNKPRVRKVKVCSVSGELPGPYCQHQRETLFIPGISPITPCSIHRLVHIDDVTQLRACPDQVTAYTSKVFEFWSSDLLKLFKIGGIEKITPPPYKPECASTFIPNVQLTRELTPGTSSPDIVSPQSGIEYTLRIGSLQKISHNEQSAHSNKLPFRAIADTDVSSLFWFVNQSFIGKSKPTETLFWPAQNGDFIVYVVDDKGRSATRKIKVSIRD